jgi:glycosyltransferase involved in cell wall biosynthesis
MQKQLQTDQLSSEKVPASTAPRVSIGVPVYNGEQFIRETLDSILRQTFKDFELIISDNASTDKTAEICQEYAAKDDRIRYYRNEENFGAAYNYNRTVALARGAYFKWASCDDLIAPEFLARCVEALDRNPSVVLCYSKEISIDETSQPIGRCSYRLDFRFSRPHQRYKCFHDLWRDRGYVHGNPVFGLMRTDKLRMTPLHGTAVSSEMALVGELLLIGEFCEIPEDLFFFRSHARTSRALRQQSGWEELAVWFDPTNRGKIVTPTWGMLKLQLDSVHRVPMSGVEKAFCYAQLGKWISWKWKQLAKESIAATIQSSRRVFKKSP